MKTISMKILGGEEIVAELLETKTTGSGMLLESTNETSQVISYVVRRPHVLRFIGTGNGANLAFVPWTLSNPTIESLEIPAAAVLLVFDPAPNVENQYLSQTSGIEIAKPTNRIST